MKRAALVLGLFLSVYCVPVLATISVELHALVERAAGEFEQMQISDGGALRTGDLVQLRVTPQADGYVYVFAYGSSGSAQLLHPITGNSQDARVRGGVQRTIPGPGVYVPLDERTGEEGLFAVWSAAAISNPSGLLGRLESASPDVQRAAGVVRASFPDARLISFRHLGRQPLLGVTGSPASLGTASLPAQAAQGAASQGLSIGADEFTIVSRPGAASGSAAGSAGGPVFSGGLGELTSIEVESGQMGSTPLLPESGVLSGAGSKLRAFEGINVPLAPPDEPLTRPATPEPQSSFGTQPGSPVLSSLAADSTAVSATSIDDGSTGLVGKFVGWLGFSERESSKIAPTAAAAVSIHPLPQVGESRQAIELQGEDGAVDSPMTPASPSAGLFVTGRDTNTGETSRGSIVTPPPVPASTPISSGGDRVLEATIQPSASAREGEVDHAVVTSPATASASTGGLLKTQGEGRRQRPESTVASQSGGGEGPASGGDDANASASVVPVVNAGAQLAVHATLPVPTPTLATTAVRTAAAAVAMVVTPTGKGAGVLVDGTGHVLTNWHLVRDYAEVAVQFNGVSGSAHPERASLISFNRSADLALLRLHTAPEGVAPISLADASDVRDGSVLQAVVHASGETQVSTTPVTIDLLRDAGSWPAADGFLHRASLLRGRGKLDATVEGAPLLDGSLRLVALTAQAGRSGDRLYAVSLVTIRDFLRATGVESTVFVSGG